MQNKLGNERLTRKKTWVIACACILAAWIGSIPFIHSNLLRLLIVPPSGFFAALSMRSWLLARRKLFIRDQFKWLLEHLLTRVSSGATLEHAFTEAPAQLGQLLGEKSDVLKSLKRIEIQLESRKPFDQLMPYLLRSLPCPEAGFFLRVLPILRKSGGDVCQFIRRHLGMLSEHISLIQDLDAETAQRQTEAAVLCLMPFGMAFLLRQSGDYYAVSPTTLGTAGMLVAYVLAVTAAALTVSMIIFREPIRKGKVMRLNQTRLMQLQLIQFFGKKLLLIYKNHLPEIFGARLLEALQNQDKSANPNHEAMFKSYFARKFLYLLVGLLISIFVLIIDPAEFYLIAFFPIGFVILQDFQVFRNVKQQQLIDQIDYTEFLSLVSSLLHSGLSLHTSLAIYLHAQSNQLDTQALTSGLSELAKKIDGGVSAGRAMEEMAASCGIPQIQSALLMAVRYDREGGIENLQLLQIQLSSCWSLFRRAMQKKLERQALQLLLPMLIDLASVMIIAILPAIQTMQSL
jgi:Flp pilus assembly protein TadB